MKRFLWWTFYTENDLEVLIRYAEKEIAILEEEKERVKKGVSPFGNKFEFYVGAICATGAFKDRVNAVKMIGDICEE